jgi:hypothetical protein
MSPINPSVPVALQIFFGLSTLLTVYLFYLAGGKKTKLLLLAGGLMVFQSLLAISGILLNMEQLPPPLLLVILPSVLLILYCFFSQSGKSFLDSLNYTSLNYLHIVRIPVEIVLFLLFSRGLIPESMTFEGRNFDLFSGLSAGLIAYFGYQRKVLSARLLMIWNWVCLALVLQVVITGILSAPSPIQQLSFHEPNIGVLLFPFVWLPGIVVPLVMFAHFASIRQLRKAT